VKFLDETTIPYYPFRYNALKSTPNDTYIKIDYDSFLFNEEYMTFVEGGSGIVQESIYEIICEGQRCGFRINDVVYPIRNRQWTFNNDEQLSISYDRLCNVFAKHEIRKIGDKAFEEFKSYAFEPDFCQLISQIKCNYYLPFHCAIAEKYKKLFDSVRLYEEIEDFDGVQIFTDTGDGEHNLGLYTDPKKGTHYHLRHWYNQTIDGKVMHFTSEEDPLVIKTNEIYALKPTYSYYFMHKYFEDVLNRILTDLHYEFYENYLESLKKYSVRSPLFYDENQIEYLAGTFLSKTIDIFQKIYEDEIKIFSNESYYKKELDYDEFVHYRLVVHNKGLNITNHCTLVPFLNIIESDLTLYNSYHIIKENGDIKIISKKDIKKGDEIILNSYNKPNPLRLVLEGKTEEKLVNYFEEFWISAFSPGLYYQYGIQDIDFFRNYDINLLDKDFVSKCIKLYSDNAEYLNGDGSEIWSYNVLESNLYFYKEHFDTITKTKIYEIFYNKDDRINIERIVRGEKKMIEDKLAQVSKILDVIIEEDRKNKKKRMEENKFENNEYNDNKENDEPDL